MKTTVPIFKNWVPNWLIWVAIFMVTLPSMGLFGVSTASGSAAAGYYGIEPADVQYSMVIFYAAVASFFALERRFFNFVAVKQYLLLSTVIEIITSYVCYTTHNLHMLFVFRFLQGMANCATTSICITLIFGRLHTERAREIGYSAFYCVLLCIAPFTTLVTAPMLDSFDYSILYKGIIFFYLPGTTLLFVVMNNVRLNKKFPLYQVDWASFILYGLILCITGYVLVYGQQYYWLQDKRIIAGVVSIFLLLCIHVLRQAHQKRPYLSLQVFNHRNFKIGALLIFFLYLCRGAFGITSTYFATVLGLDPIHIGYLLLINISGIILGVLASSRLIVYKRSMRLIWMAGFAFLLSFHLWMRILFATQANTSEFFIPLLIQGIGTGLLMTPLIVFMVSSVPPDLSSTASATGVFFRFTGFCTSIALVNYFSLHQQSEHYNRFQQALTDLDPAAVQRLTGYRQILVSRGMAPDQATRLANGLLSRSAQAQSQLRFAMDYYLLISWIILIIILVIALVPYLNRTTVNLKASQPAPVSY